MKTAPDIAQPSATLSWLIVELTNICNLHCSYCLRDEDALYHTRASHLPIDLLRRILREARECAGIRHVSFTGGETTLHPKFNEVIEAVRDEGLTASFVTNGWHFQRVWPTLAANRATIDHVAFSLDGATREAHDGWRGEGSFNRLISAFARCRAGGIKFHVKVMLRRDVVPQLEQIALLAARLGADALSFAHTLPTSGAFDESAMTLAERRYAEEEIATLRSIFKMKISIDVGYANTDPAPPCNALLGLTANVDYRGRLSLCCNISGFRGATKDEPDVVADLAREDFAEGYARLKRVVEEQLARRREALSALAASGVEADLYTASPCLLCMNDFGKMPWRAASARNSRALPVLSTTL
ncbi:MAG TPA: radical SAM protein [Pyrinomonadaceae bacterium]|nr:radical SAM protein [Pyrinomonadaceae bacterium]